MPWAMTERLKCVKFFPALAGTDVVLTESTRVKLPGICPIGASVIHGVMLDLDECLGEGQVLKLASGPSTNNESGWIADKLHR